MNFTGNITGTLVKSELKFGQSGKPFWKGRVAVNHKRKNQQGAFEESGTTWVNVTAFGHAAENAANTLHDKTLVTASGRMETRAWQKQDGTPGESLELTADTLGAAVAPWPDKNQRPTPDQTQQWGGGQSDPWAGQSPGGGSWDTPQNNQPAF